MAKPEVLPCPLCHGHSQVSVSELREFANSGVLQQSIGNSWLHMPPLPTSFNLAAGKGRGPTS